MEKSVEEIKKARKELIYLSSDEKQRDLYLRRKMAISDRVSDLENAEKKGEDRGIELTKKVFKLSNSGKSIDEIAKECEVSVDKINKILE
ncbi:MAG: hypothetical protein ACRC28_01360 [Clostridium sp.]|uniref:hypothetical protein n=1 Tax=Clostridium sp. TaxID=1506 RepID=UPI003F308E3C